MKIQTIEEKNGCSFLCTRSVTYGTAHINGVSRLFIYDAEIVEDNFIGTIAIFKTTRRLSRHYFYRQQTTSMSMNKIDFNTIEQLKKNLLLIKIKHKTKDEKKDLECFLNELYYKLDFLKWKRKIFITNGL